MKCSIAPEEIKELEGKQITLDVNGRSQVALVSDGILCRRDGQFCLSTGSSGWDFDKKASVVFAKS